jgi:hypothetical protein
VNGEDAVRSYLTYLDDPASIRNDDEIATRRRAVAKAVDPVEKLMAVAALRSAERLDGSEYRERFIREARGWAQREGITTSAFVEIGVPLADLRAAGFDVSGGRAGRGGRRRRTASRPTEAARPRRARRRDGRTRVTSDSIREAILATSEPFTTSTLRELTGGSLGTIRKVLGDLVAAGEVGELGPDHNRKRRGRAPIRYQRA